MVRSPPWQPPHPTGKSGGPGGERNDPTVESRLLGCRDRDSVGATRPGASSASSQSLLRVSARGAQPWDAGRTLLGGAASGRIGSLGTKARERPSSPSRPQVFLSGPIHDPTWTLGTEGRHWRGLCSQSGVRASSPPLAPTAPWPGEAPGPRSSSERGLGFGSQTPATAPCSRGPSRGRWVAGPLHPAQPDFLRVWSSFCLLHLALLSLLF